MKTTRTVTAILPVLALACSALLVSNAADQPAPEKPAPFVKKGMEVIQENDGYIERPVSPERIKELNNKMKTLKYDRSQPFGNEGSGVFGIAAQLAEPFHGGTQSVVIQGKGGERPHTYIITYTDEGLLDDQTSAIRYEYTITAGGDGDLILVKARSWRKPWPGRR